MKQLRVTVIANANVGAALLDWRVVRNPLYAFIRTAAEHAADLDVTRDLDLPGSARTHIHVPGAGSEIDTRSAVDSEGPLKCALGGSQRGQGTHCDADGQYQETILSVFHKGVLILNECECRPSRYERKAAAHRQTLFRGSYVRPGVGRLGPSWSPDDPPRRCRNPLWHPGRKRRLKAVEGQHLLNWYEPSIHIC